MAEYLILIYQDEAFLENPQPGPTRQMMEGHRVFRERHGDAIRGGKGLQPTAAATSLRQDLSGAFAITDGPFAETKEALGGYYLIEAADLDEAIALAKEVPAPIGGVEVRPVLVFG